MFVGAATAAATGNNSTTVNKTVTGSDSSNIATVGTTPPIIDHGIYSWKNSKGYSCYLKWVDYKYSSHYVVVKYSYKYQTRYFSGKLALINKES